MPYACSAGDADPVVVHLQQLDGDFEVVDFCAQHWVQFVYATAETLGMFDPGDVDGTPHPDPDEADPAPNDSSDPDTGTPDPESGDGSGVPDDAATTAAEPEPAPH